MTRSWVTRNFERNNEARFLDWAKKNRVWNVRGVYNYAKYKKLAVKDFLKEWVDCNQPTDFCSGVSSKEMCFYASLALEGKPFIYYRNPDYRKTRYGKLLYDYMWGLKNSDDLELSFIIKQYE